MGFFDRQLAYAGSGGEGPGPTPPQPIGNVVKIHLWFPLNDVWTFTMYCARTGDIEIAWGDGTLQTATGASSAESTFTHAYYGPVEPTIEISPRDNVRDLRVTSLLCSGIENIPLTSTSSLKASSFTSVRAQELVLPEGIETIGANAFQDCRTLKKLNIPAGLETIGNYAFMNCNYLAVSELPDSITSIGVSGLEGCNLLNLRKLPDSLTTIGNYAFRNSTYMRITSLPGGLKTIGQNAFSNDTRMAVSIFPASITTIGAQAFNGGAMKNTRTVIFQGTPTSLGASLFGGDGYAIYDIYVPWASGALANAPWGAGSTIVHYNNTYLTHEALDEHYNTPVLYHPLDTDLSTLPTGQSCTLTGSNRELTTYKGIACTRFGASTYYTMSTPIQKGSQGGGRVFAVSLWVAFSGAPQQNRFFFRTGMSVTGAGCSMMLCHPDDRNVGCCASISNNGTLLSQGNNTYRQLFAKTDTGWHHIVMNCHMHNGWTSADWDMDIFMDGVHQWSLYKHISSNRGMAGMFLGIDSSSSSSVYFAGLRVFYKNISQEKITELSQEFTPTE